MYALDVAESTRDTSSTPIRIEVDAQIATPLRVNAALEDLAGNSIGRVFDAVVLRPTAKLR